MKALSSTEIAKAREVRMNAIVKTLKHGDTSKIELPETKSGQFAVKANKKPSYSL